MMSATTTTLRERFLAFDDQLATLGVPPLTAWWREGIGRWLDAYERGRVLELWACVGRGAAKSTVIYKLALYFTLFTRVVVPVGERHYAIVLSRLVEEASKAIPIIARWLTLLGVPHHVAGDTIELGDVPRGIRVVAKSVAATSGWRAFFLAKDERSKWPSGGIDGLDAEEIDTSAAAMTATHSDAPIVAVGSAWGMFGVFYDAIMGGDDATRIVLGPTPTWIAAPHITEDDCRRKERDPRRFAREYQSVFQAGADAAFSAEHVDAANVARDDGVPCEAHLILDMSSGRKDRATWAVARWMIVEPPPGEQPGSRDYMRFDAINGLDGGFWSSVSGPRLVAKIADQAKIWGAKHVHGDQRESFMLRGEFQRHDLTFHEHPYTAQSKPRAVEIARRWFADRRISFQHDELRNELVSFTETIAPSGQLTFAGRGSHDDFVSLILTAALADLSGHIPHRFAREPGQLCPPIQTREPFARVIRMGAHHDDVTNMPDLAAALANQLR